MCAISSSAHFFLSIILLSCISQVSLSHFSAFHKHKYELKPIQRKEFAFFVYM